MCVGHDFYAFALAEQMRAEVEEHGRVELGPAELHLLSLTKNIHIALITAAIPTIIFSMKWGTCFFSGMLIVPLIGGLGWLSRFSV